MTEQTEIIPAPDILRLIYSVREQRVILDADLANLYNVPTKRLNEQLRRNLSRFPVDFAFRLTPEEWQKLKPQIANQANIAPQNRSQFATGSQKHRDPRFPPVAFTEHGALMAANILNSPRATAMSVYIIRAFVRMREDLAANSAILKRLAEIDKTLLMHDVALREIFQKLLPLLEPPPQPPKPEIGFHIKEDAVPYRVKKRRKQEAATRPVGEELELEVSQMPAARFAEPILRPFSSDKVLTKFVKSIKFMVFG